MISPELKDYIMQLGNNFANRKSREELHRLSNSFLHKKNADE